MSWPSHVAGRVYCGCSRRPSEKLSSSVEAAWRLQGVEFWLRSVADHPHGVYDGKDWSFWQYTSTGLVPGIAGRVDINVFAGSKQAWAGWLAARAQ